MEKLGVSLPSSLASLNSGKSGQNLAKVVQSDFTAENEKALPLRGETPLLGKAVPSWESSEMVPEGGAILIGSINAGNGKGTICPPHRPHVCSRPVVREALHSRDL